MTMYGRPRGSEAMEVLGFLTVGEANHGLSMLRQYHQGLTYVALFHFPINSRGEISGQPDRALIDSVHDYGLGALIVLSNFIGTQFNPYVMRNILAYNDVQQTLLANLTNMLNTYNLDGVNLDLENMFAEDRHRFSRFVSNLTGILRARGKLVTISVPAKLQDEPQAHWRGAFDYSAIGQAVDRVVLMTYEEHWAGSDPGAVASTPWVNGVLTYATARISPAKLYLGLPLYGYDWPSQGSGKSVTYTHAMNLATKYRVPIQWDDVMQAPNFTYTDEKGMSHEVWFENVQSVQAKVALAQQFGLKGFGIWEMKLSFPQFWQYLIRNLVIAKPQ